MPPISCPCPRIGWTMVAFRAIGVALADVLRHGVASGRRWGFKDPRTARLMPLWRQVFQSAGVQPRYIFCVRNPAQVARSVSARDRTARDQAEYRWVLYNGAAVAELGAAPVCLVPYEHWFSAPEDTARRIGGFLGLAPPPPGLVAGIVDPGLRHDDDALAPARPLARRLYRVILDGMAEQNGEPVFARRCARLLHMPGRIRATGAAAARRARGIARQRRRPEQGHWRSERRDQGFAAGRGMTCCSRVGGDVPSPPNPPSICRARPHYRRGVWGGAGTAPPTLLSEYYAAASRPLPSTPSALATPNSPGNPPLAKSRVTCPILRPGRASALP